MFIPTSLLKYGLPTKPKLDSPQRINNLLWERHRASQQAHQARQNRIELPEFLLGAWQVLQPGRQLVMNWHIEYLCDLLMAVSYGVIDINVLINIAPRHLKSLLISTVWPCWEWLYWPHYRYLCLSYASELSNTHNDDRRKIIQSPWYQSLAQQYLGNPIKLSSSMNRITEFENQYMGKMVSRGFDGSVTGIGGDRLIIDDPNNPEKDESDKIRESTLNKFKSYSVGRRDDQKKTRVIAIQQRTHPEDVSGYIKKELGEYYQTFILPTVADVDEVHSFPLSGKIITRKAGELLFPARIGERELAEIKKTMTPYQYAARHQQNPVQMEGGMIPLEWFNRYTIPPANPERVMISVDTAASKSDIACPWCFQTWYQYQNNYYLVDVFLQHMTYPEGRLNLKNYVARESAKRSVNGVLIEDKSTGQALIPDLQQDPDFPCAVIAVDPGNLDKITRMSVESATIMGRQVWLPEQAPWLFDFEVEIKQFPNSKTKDQVDTLSQMLKWFRENAVTSWLELYRID